MNGEPLRRNEFVRNENSVQQFEIAIKMNNIEKKNLSLPLSRSYLVSHFFFHSFIGSQHQFYEYVWIAFTQQLFTFMDRAGAGSSWLMLLLLLLTWNLYGRIWHDRIQKTSSPQYTWMPLYDVYNSKCGSVNACQNHFTIRLIPICGSSSSYFDRNVNK